MLNVVDEFNSVSVVGDQFSTELQNDKNLSNMIEDINEGMSNMIQSEKNELGDGVVDFNNNDRNLEGGVEKNTSDSGKERTDYLKDFNNNNEKEDMVENLDGIVKGKIQKGKGEQNQDISYSNDEPSNNILKEVKDYLLEISKQSKYVMQEDLGNNFAGNEEDILQFDSNEPAVEFHLNPRQRFIVEDCNNFIMMAEVADNAYRDPIWLLLGERESEIKDLDEFMRMDVDEEENFDTKDFQFINQQTFTNEFYELDDGISEENEYFQNDIDEDDDDEEDMRMRVYWGTAGLIKETPSPTIFRLDKIPDSARPTMVKIESTDDYLKTQRKHKNVTSVVMKPQGQFKEIFTKRNKDRQTNKYKEKQTGVGEKRGISKIWNRLMKVLRLKQQD